MAAIVKLRRHIKNPTALADAYIREEHYCQISSRSNLKPRRLRLVWKASPPQEQEEEQDE